MVFVLIELTIFYLFIFCFHVIPDSDENLRYDLFGRFHISSFCSVIFSVTDRSIVICSRHLHTRNLRAWPTVIKKLTIKRLFLYFFFHCRFVGRPFEAGPLVITNCIFSKGKSSINTGTFYSVSLSLSRSMGDRFCENIAEKCLNWFFFLDKKI